VEVHWPSGTVDKLAKVPANRVVIVVEGQAASGAAF
jgi:hypothetical protein